MTITLTHIIRSFRPWQLLAVMLSALFVTACDDNATTNGPEDILGGSGDYVSIKLKAINPSRASNESHPDIGAVNRETNVEELTLFLYTDEKKLNGNADTPLDFAIHIPKHKFTYVTNDQITIVFRTGEYKITGLENIAVLVNMGDQTKLSKLSDIHELTPSSWTSALTLDEYDRFAMSNAMAGNDTDSKVISYKVTGEDGTTEKRYRAEITVERLAARIDIDYSTSSPIYHKPGNDNLDYLSYVVKDSESKDIAKVHISHIIPFNVMQDPTYALKRISATATDDLNCFESHTHTGTLAKVDGRPTQYVIEPHTKEKPMRSESSEISESSESSTKPEWYGSTAISSLVEAHKSNAAFTDDNRLSATWGNEKLHLSDSYSNSAFILAYANENTCHVKAYSSDCMTGLAIRAVFDPVILYTDGTDLTKFEQSNFGKDLWRYTPRNVTTGEENVRYFNTEKAAEDYKEANPSDDAEITEYPGGVCYYYVWIRHTVDDRTPHDPFPMEYGIVRNHVYRVGFNFTGIGHEDFNQREPWNVEPLIYVRPWRLFRHETIIM